MLRYYLDSNIYRLLKPVHPHHRTDLKKMLEEVQDDLLILYSDAHFDDLKDSKQEYRDADLRLIGEYAKDKYFTMDLQHNLKYFLVDPLTAFYEKDYAAAEDFLREPDQLDAILDDDEDPLMASMKSLLKSFFSLPLRFFDPGMQDLNKLPAEHQGWLERMAPGYSPNLSLKDFWQSTLSYSTKMMGDEKEMKKMRKYLAAYVDRDLYSWDKWKYRFNARFKETAVGKTFKELVDGMLLNDQKQDLWLKIIYLYSLLEMYGITQERSGKKAKNNSMGDLIKDANHVFYGSFCDYLVTEDKGMQLKAHIIYELMNYSTEVLTINDLMNRRQLLHDQESEESFLAALEHDIKHGFRLYSIPDILNADEVSSYKATVSYFGYFNRFQVRPGGREISLYCTRKAPRANFVMYHELLIITRRLLDAFGMDDEQKGAYLLDEKEIGENIRTWSRSRVHYVLSSYRQGASSFIMLSVIFPQINLH